MTIKKNLILSNEILPSLDLELKLNLNLDVNKVKHQFVDLSSLRAFSNVLLDGLLSSPLY
jgi:hypothetical protein